MIPGNIEAHWLNAMTKDTRKTGAYCRICRDERQLCEQDTSEDQTWIQDDSLRYSH